MHFYGKNLKVSTYEYTKGMRDMSGCVLPYSGIIYLDFNTCTVLLMCLYYYRGYLVQI